MIRRGLILVLSILPMLVACGKKDTPEAQVRATIAHAEAAAEKKDVSTLRGLVSEKYSDAQSQDKRTIDGVLRFYFLRNEKLYFFTHIRSVAVPETGRATAVVYVAMAAQPVKSAKELQGIRSSLYRFDLTFMKEGNTWRVVTAEWRPAELVEFL